jgi:hypothetical protein
MGDGLASDDAPRTWDAGHDLEVGIELEARIMFQDVRDAPRAWARQHGVDRLAGTLSDPGCRLAASQKRPRARRRKEKRKDHVLIFFSRCAQLKVTEWQWVLVFYYSPVIAARMMGNKMDDGQQQDDGVVR